MINSTLARAKEVSLEDNALLESYLEGESTAFDLLVMRYQDRLINYINGIIHDYEQSVDLTQETFIRLFKNAHKYEGKYKFSTWLYRIATNIAIDELRGRNKKGRFFFRNVLDCFRPDENGSSEEFLLPDTSFCPGKALEESEKAGNLQLAISSLAEPYRVPFLLKEVQDLSYEEVSHVLNLPQGTVKSRVHRAKLLLREKLQGVL
jgi:RNA polymerase sigma-70 factor (ECF subfamily)